MIGIYKITNTISGKIYIGSSLHVERRLTDHKYLLKNNKHHSIKLQNSWNKHGSENFKFEIIEECNDENYLEREQYYLNKLLKCDEYLEKGNKYFLEKGYNILPKSQKGFSGKYSKETILKQLKSSGRLNNILQVDLNGNIIGDFDMKSECPDSKEVVSKSIKSGNTTIKKQYGYISKKDYIEGWKPNLFTPGMTGVKNTWTKGKEVYVYDIYNRFISKFNTLRETADFFEKDVPFISIRLNREPQKIGFPYKFYTVELNEQENILRFKKEIDDIKVFDIFNTFLGYSNIKEFSNKINCSENSVCTVLNGYRKQINGYKLKYNDIV